MSLKSLSGLKIGDYTLPTSDGTNGQVLQTDGSGNITFQSVSVSDKFTSGLSFDTSTGVLTATVANGSNVTVDLNGRYVPLSGGSGATQAMTGNLHIQTPGPIIYLKDTSDDDDQNIIFQNNAGTNEYRIATQDFTGGGGGDGFYIGSLTSDGEVALVTNSTTALTIDTSQNTTFAGSITLSGQLDGVTNMFLGEYLYHQGDGDTYLNFQGANEFRIVVGGSEKIHFNTARARINQHLYVAADSSYDIGQNATRFKTLYVDDIDGGNSSLVTSDANNYFRINTSGGSAQLGLFRTNSGTTGGGYIGIDGANFRIYNESFSPKFTLSTSSGDATFTGNISASNFSGSSSGTNTGDQDLSSLATVASPTFTGDITIPQYVYHTSDGNTAFGFPSNDNFRVITGGTTRLNISSAIELTGSTTITGGLTTTGNIVVGNDLYVPNEIYHTGDTDTSIRISAEDQFRIVTGGGNRFQVQNTKY